MPSVGRSVTCLLLVALAGCDEDRSKIRLTAAFSASPVQGTAPLVVQFTDQSLGAIGLWEWSFGDGELLPSVVASSPSHTYTEPGTYTVVLHAVACTSAIDCAHAWETKTELITVTAPVLAGSPEAPSAARAVLARAGEAGSVPTLGVDSLTDGGVRPAQGSELLELLLRCSESETASDCWLDGLEARLLLGTSQLPFVREPGVPGDPAHAEARHVLAWLGPWTLVEPRPRLLFLVGPGDGDDPAPGRALTRDARLASLELRAARGGLTRTVLRGSVGGSAAAPGGR